MRRWMAACAFAAGIALAGGTSAHGDMGHGKKTSKSAGGHGTAVGVPGRPGDVTRTVEVEMIDAMRYRPDHIRVRRGETIRFIVRNTGRLRHEMVLDTLEELKEHAALMRKSPGMKHADPNAVSVPPGETGELIWRFTRAGTVPFACLEPGHFEAGMTGEIAVGRQAE